MESGEERSSKRRVRPTYKETESKLRTEVAETEQALEQAKQDNMKLKTTGKALENVVEYISALHGVLTSAQLHGSLMPSSRLAPDPVQTFAHLSMESAWRGERPCKAWIDAWSCMPPIGVKNFNSDFLNRLQSAVEYYKVANDGTKEEVQKSISMAIKVRSDIVHTISTKNPLVVQISRALMEVPEPKDPQDGGPEKILRRVLSEMHFTGEQKATVREAWGKFCHSRDLIYAHIAEISSLQARIQLEGATQLEASECNLKPEKFRAEDALKTLKIANRLQDCNVRFVMAHGQLAIEVVDCISWQQFAATNLSLRPYNNDIIQWCALFSELYL